MEKDKINYLRSESEEFNRFYNRTQRKKKIGRVAIPSTMLSAGSIISYAAWDTEFLNYMACGYSALIGLLGLLYPISYSETMDERIEEKEEDIEKILKEAEEKEL